VEEISEITVYNILGQIVHKALPNSASYVADLSSLDSGVYLIQIVSSAGTTTKRVVKQ